MNKGKIVSLVLIAVLAIMMLFNSGCKSDFQIKASQQVFYKDENNGQEHLSRKSAGEGYWCWGRSYEIGGDK